MLLFGITFGKKFISQLVKIYLPWSHGFLYYKEWYSTLVLLYTLVITCAWFHLPLHWFCLYFYIWWILQWFLYIFPKLLFQVITESFTAQQPGTTRRKHLLVNLTQVIIFHCFNYCCSCLQNKCKIANKDISKWICMIGESPQWSTAGLFKDNESIKKGYVLSDKNSWPC